MDTSTFPKTRAEAKAIGADYYFTGLPCKHGHTALRKTKGACVECVKAEIEKYRERRSGYFTAYNKSERGKESKRRYYERNRELVISRAAARPPEEKKAAQKKWKDGNVLWVRADTKNRRAKHRQATPPWLTRAQKKEMRELYKIAMTMTKITGVKYVVDHIVPLRSDTVCGLHVPWNLQVITQAENLVKSNKVVDSLP